MSNKHYLFQSQYFFGGQYLVGRELQFRVLLLFLGQEGQWRKNGKQRKNARNASNEKQRKNARNASGF